MYIRIFIGRVIQHQHQAALGAVLVEDIAKVKCTYPTSDTMHYRCETGLTAGCIYTAINNCDFMLRAKNILRLNIDGGHWRKLSALKNRSRMSSVLCVADTERGLVQAGAAKRWFICLYVGSLTSFSFLPSSFLSQCHLYVEPSGHSPPGALWRGGHRWRPTG